MNTHCCCCCCCCRLELQALLAACWHQAPGHRELLGPPLLLLATDDDGAVRQAALFFWDEALPPGLAGRLQVRWLAAGGWLALPGMHWAYLACTEDARSCHRCQDEHQASRCCLPCMQCMQGPLLAPATPLPLRHPAAAARLQRVP